MPGRAWKWAILALEFAALLAKPGAASCGSDVGKARADRMEMHCQRVNTSTQVSCAAIDCSTLSSMVQAFCGNTQGRPTFCNEYPALITSKHVGIPPDLERIMSTAAEDGPATEEGITKMRNTFALVTSLAAPLKLAKTIVAEEQRSLAQHSKAASAASKRYKAAVDSKSAAQLAEVPKLLEAARTDFKAAASIGESLIKHTAEARENERKVAAAVWGGDTIAAGINFYAGDAKNAELVLDDALRTGAKAQADADAMAHVKALRDQAVEIAKNAGKSATEATELARKAHTLAEMGPHYDAREDEARATTEDEAQKKNVDEMKQGLAALSETSGNVCDRAMLERAWKVSGRATSANGGLVPVVLHTLDAKALEQACPFLKATLAQPETASRTSAAQSVDVGVVKFADLGLEILVLVASGAKPDPHGRSHTLFVNEGGGFARPSGSIVTKELAGFARKGVDIFAILAEAEWKLRQTPGKAPEFVFSRPR